MADRKRKDQSSQPAKTDTGLSETELKQVRELKSRDREVRAHEQAHAAVAGALARGGPSFDYRRGPDGTLYAVGGEVSIDTSVVSGDPQATIDKAQRIRSAALAPAEPSFQDRAVAARASAMEAEARAELKKEGEAEFQGEEKVAEASDPDKKADVDASNGSKSHGENDRQLETGNECSICGGQHSAESHVSDVKHQLNAAFSVAEIDHGAVVTTGKLLNISV